MDADRMRDLYRYTEWANARILGCLRPLPVETLSRDLGSSFPTLRQTFAHLLVGEWFWLERWLGRSPADLPALPHDAELETLEAQLRDVEARRRPFLDRLDEAALGRTVDYVSTTGERDAFLLGDLLVHVANHSTFHRGQLAGMLRQVGARPVPTDFTAFRRTERA